MAANIQLSIDLTPLRELAAQMGKDFDKLDFRKPLTVIKTLLTNATKECFHGSHDPEGRSWAPLKKPRASKSKGKRKGTASSAPLIDTGNLWRSVGAGTDAINEVGQHHMEYGTNVKYAHFHQDGTKHIPARPFLGITDKQVQQFEDVLVKHVLKALGF